MLTDSENAKADDTAEADVLIVGAGAVGLTMAIKLARAGRTVMLLEAGPVGLASHSQSLFEAAQSVGRRHTGLVGGRFRMLGGTTNFWGGQLVPFDAHVFEPRPWLRDDTGWPISRADIEDFYGEVLDLLGMARAIRSDPEVLARLKDPMPALSDDIEYFYSRWAPQPNLATHFADEIRSLKNLRCITDAQVAGLTMQGARVTGVEIVDPRGARRQLTARKVVLANGTFEISRLMLAPLTDGGKAPWRDNPWVGRGFIDHLDVTAGRFRILDKKRFFDGFENVILDGLKYQPRIKLSSKAQDGKYVDIAAHLIFNSTYTAHYDNAKIFIRSFLRGSFDRDLRSYPRKIFNLLRFGLPMALRYLQANRIASMADAGVDLRMTSEQIMVLESHVELGEQLDAIGLPLLNLHWKIDGRELETMAHFAERLADAFRGSGVAEIDIDPALRARDPSFMDTAGDTAHQMGMARMADSPVNGVVDRNLKVFAADNLYIAGAAVYPSSGFPNPTFTAMALGSRLANHLMSEAQ